MVGIDNSNVGGGQRTSGTPRAAQAKEASPFDDPKVREFYDIVTSISRGKAFDAEALRATLQNENVQGLLRRGAGSELIYAVRAQSNALFNGILSVGGNPNDRYHTIGDSALGEAAKVGRADYVERLLKAGHKLGTCSSHLDFHGSENPVLVAARNGRVDILRLLTEYEADLDQRPRDSRCALSFAAAEGHLDCVRFLLEREADPNGTPGIDHPIVSAVNRNQLEAARILIEAGASADATNNSHCVNPRGSALALAVQNGNMETTELLLSNSKDYNANDQFSHALAVAAWRGDPAKANQFVDVLLKHYSRQPDRDPRVLDAALVNAVDYENGALAERLRRLGARTP